MRKIYAFAKPEEVDLKVRTQVLALEPILMPHIGKSITSSRTAKYRNHEHYDLPAAIQIYDP